MLRREPGQSESERLSSAPRRRSGPGERGRGPRERAEAAWIVEGWRVGGDAGGGAAEAPRGNLAGGGPGSAGRRAGAAERVGKLGRARSGDESDRAFLGKRKVSRTPQEPRTGKDGAGNAVGEGASVAGAEGGWEIFPERSFIHSVGAQEAFPQ